MELEVFETVVQVAIAIQSLDFQCVFESCRRAVQITRQAVAGQAKLLGNEVRNTWRHIGWVLQKGAEKSNRAELESEPQAVVANRRSEGTFSKPNIQCIREFDQLGPHGFFTNSSVFPCWP